MTRHDVEKLGSGVTMKNPDEGSADVFELTPCSFAHFTRKVNSLGSGLSVMKIKRRLRSSSRNFEGKEE